MKQPAPSGRRKSLEFSASIQSFPVRNPGEKEQFYELEMTGDPVFVVVTPSKLHLEPKATGKVEVKFSPVTEGYLMVREALFSAAVHVWRVGDRTGARVLVDTVVLKGKAPGYVDLYNCIGHTGLATPKKGGKKYG